MLEARPIVLLLAVTILVGAACGSTASHPSSADPGAGPSAGRPGTHDHSWRNLQDLGNGVQMETSLQTCEEVVRPGTDERMRPLAVQIEFEHSLGATTKLKSLKLHPIEDTTPLLFTLTVGPSGYKVTIEPKTGFSWGTVRQVGDVKVVVVEFDPPEPRPGQEGHTAVPVGM